MVGATVKTLRLIFFLAGFALAARGAERDVVRVFPVQPGAALKVDLYRGAVTVEESDAAEIRVEAHIEINTDSETKAERLVAALNFEVVADGNTVTVRAADPSGRGVRLALSDDPPVDLICRIVLPRQCDVDLRSHAGAITVGNLTGRIVVRTAKGNIFLRRIDGSVDARTDSGDVIVSRCSGAVVARTDGGVIRLGTVGGRAELHNTNGDIEVLAAAGGLDAIADAGDVTVGFPKGFSGDAKIKTAYGNITAKIDPAADCNVSASSFWSHVQTTLPLTVESGGDGKGKLTGRLNHGGPRITLSADGGQVKIVPGETFFN